MRLLSLRKIFITIYLLSGAAFFASAQDNFSDLITYVSGKDNNIVVEVTVTSEEKDLLEALACKSVVNAYLFKGIEGVASGKPLLSEKDLDEYSHYFKNLFRSRYTVFANNPQKIVKPKKTDGLFTATYQVSFHGETLEKDLVNNNVIDGKKPVASLPTMMVVPFKYPNQTYSEVLESSPYIRAAIHQIEEELKKKGYSTIDYIAAYEEAKRRGDFTSGNEDSYVNQLISGIGADIKIIVTIEISSEYRSNSATVHLKAVYCTDGSISANATKTYRSELPTNRCIVGAIHNVMREFKPYTQWPHISGKTSLDVGIESGSTLSMDTQLDKNSKNPADQTLGEAISIWVRRNAKVFHMKGVSDVAVIFDEIILKKDENPADFARNLRRYISMLSVDGVRLKASYNVDGLSLYFTISETEEL